MLDQTEGYTTADGRQIGPANAQRRKPLLDLSRQFLNGNVLRLRVIQINQQQIARAVRCFRRGAFQTRLLQPFAQRCIINSFGFAHVVITVTPGTRSISHMSSS